MAIAFLRVTFPNLSLDRGAQKLLAYLGRYRVFDRWLGQDFDFTVVARDRVYQAVVLPDDAPAEFDKPIRLARAIDKVEARRLRTRAPRERWPQIGAAFVGALPPDSELTYDQAVEFSHRLVDRIRLDLAIAVYLVIHDPALEEPGSVNRHLHILATTRGLNRFGFFLNRIRGLFASPRSGSEQNTNRNYVAEGIHWPRLHRDLLQQFFFELGLDLAVDPHLPYGRRHWSAAALRDEAEKVEADRRRVDARNRAIVFGNPSTLVDLLRAGRTTVTVAAVRRILMHFIDYEEVLKQRLEEILADPNVVSYSLHPDGSPARLSTRGVHDLVASALNAVLADRAQDEAQWLAVVSDRDADAVLARISTEIQPLNGRRLILTGQLESHCRDLQTGLENFESTVTSIDSLLKPGLRSKYSTDAPIEIEQDDLIVVPKSEQIDDERLAALITGAASRGARLILGYDESAGAGVSVNRLSSRIAELFEQPLPVLGAQEIARQLRCGRTEVPIRALDALGVLQFENAEASSVWASDFIVCDDEFQLHQINTQDAYEAAGANCIDHGLYKLSPGEWIAFTRTNYDIIPPDLRAGRLAKILHILPDGRRLLVAHCDDSLLEIDLDKYPHVRVARAITLAEARYAPADARLKIRLTKPRRAWSALHLAAARGGNSIVEVDPRVARNVGELIQVVCRSLPAALPSELFFHSDLNAGLVRGPIDRKASPPLAPSIEVEDFPRPEMIGWSYSASLGQPRPYGSFPNRPSGANSRKERDQEGKETMPSARRAHRIRTRLPRSSLHEKLWNILASGPNGQEFLNRLEIELDQPASTRQKTLDQLKMFPISAPTREVIRVIETLALPTEPPQLLSAEAEPDSSEDFSGPRDWSEWDIVEFKLDIKIIEHNTSFWNADPNAITTFDPTRTTQPNEDLAQTAKR